MAPKRKLDEHDVPQAITPNAESPKSTPDESTPLKDPTKTTSPEYTSFTDFGIEPRIVRSIRDLNWQSPTLCQQRVIPKALTGENILLRSGTGTGKTACYLLSILHDHIRRHDITSLILVPTKELALQVFKVTKALSAHCGTGIRAVNIAGKENDVVIRAKLTDANIVISTPARASVNVNNGALSLKNLAHLVVDEGDLIMGYGFQDDMAQISGQLPSSVQLFIMSATMSTDIEALQGLFGDREISVIKLDDLEKSSDRVRQYVIKCGEEERFLLVMAMFKLQLIKGKTIVFVGDVDRSYRVKLFLEQFGIKSCVLNSELPLASRLNVVEQFNRNVYNILVASDETEVLGSRREESEESRPKKKAKTQKSKPDSGVSRGIDFLNVSTVLNFDLGPTARSYRHRVGRTARAGKSGLAISFVIPKDKFRKHKPTSFEGSRNDEEVLAKIKAKEQIEDYAFDMKRLEPFRYRFGDALRHVTRIAVREARVKELRMELAKSQKLSRYFEENPEALQHLRHDQSLSHSMRVDPHLKHVPDYLLPGGKKPEDIGFVSLQKDDDKKRRFVKRRGGKVVRGRNGKVDPLKTFNARGRGKK